MNLIALIQICAGVLIAIVCLPLIQGKVPPNWAYGIRTRAAFESKENWYALNKYGGIVLFKSAIPIFVIGVIGLFLPRSWDIAYDIAAAIVALGSILTGSVVIFLASASMAKK